MRDFHPYILHSVPEIKREFVDGALFQGRNLVIGVAILLQERRIVAVSFFLVGAQNTPTSGVPAGFL